MQDPLNTNRKANGRWTHEQHLIFLEGLRIYGKDWKKIQQLLHTRTGTQIRSHAQKFFMKMDQSDEQGKEMQLEEVDSLTENSKIIPVGGEIRDSSSYFLNKILEHSTGSGLADFWTALVDWKHENGAKETKAGKGSFEIYERPQKEFPNIRPSL